MRPSAACYELIREWEECSLTAYQGKADRAGLWTIGWGHTGPEVSEGMVIDQDTADRLLEQDIEEAVEAVNEAINARITTQSQFDALVSFAYNVGETNLDLSSMLRLHNANQPHDAARAMLQWISSAGRKRRGLLRRRLSEAMLYAAERFIIKDIVQ